MMIIFSELRIKQLKYSCRTVATSHFEPTDARTAFPCLDEPNFKAKFHIKIIHSAEYIALSNMPIEDTRDVGNGRVEDSFQVSVSMSTYLVAFAIVDFKFKEAKTDSGIKVICCIYSLSKGSLSSFVGKQMCFSCDYMILLFGFISEGVLC